MEIFNYEDKHYLIIGYDDSIEIYDVNLSSIDLIYEKAFSYEIEDMWVQDNLLIIFADIGWDDIIYFYDISIPSAPSLVRKINLNNYF